MRAEEGINSGAGEYTNETASTAEIARLFAFCNRSPNIRSYFFSCRYYRQFKSFFNCYTHYTPAFVCRRGGIILEDCFILAIKAKQSRNLCEITRICIDRFRLELQCTLRMDLTGKTKNIKIFCFRLQFSQINLLTNRIYRAIIYLKSNMSCNFPG